MTRRHKETKRAATSRKRSGIRRPHDPHRPDLLRGVLEDLELHAELRTTFRTMMTTEV